MRWFAIGLMLILGSAALANDGGYGAAEPVNITTAPEGAPAGTREGFWLVGLGGDDRADGYRVEPSPGAGARIAIVGATETNAPAPVTLELVKRFGGEVVATASLADPQAFTDWVVDAPFYLRVFLAQGAPPVEVLVGVRIMPDVGSAPAAATETVPDDPTRALPIPEDETAPVPKLVVPAT